MNEYYGNATGRYGDPSICTYQALSPLLKGLGKRLMHDQLYKHFCVLLICCHLSAYIIAPAVNTSQNIHEVLT